MVLKVHEGGDGDIIIRDAEEVSDPTTVCVCVCVCVCLSVCVFFTCVFGAHLCAVHA